MQRRPSTRRSSPRWSGDARSSARSATQRLATGGARSTTGTPLSADQPRSRALTRQREVRPTQSACRGFAHTERLLPGRLVVSPADQLDRPAVRGTRAGWTADRSGGLNRPGNGRHRAARSTGPAARPKPAQVRGAPAWQPVEWCRRRSGGVSPSRNLIDPVGSRVPGDGEPAPRTGVGRALPDRVWWRWEGGYGYPHRPTGGGTGPWSRGLPDRRRARVSGLLDELTDTVPRGLTVDRHAAPTPATTNLQPASPPRPQAAKFTPGGLATVRRLQFAGHPSPARPGH